MSAANTFEIAFTGVESAGPSEGWRTKGYDRDGLCTLATSTDVCKRVSGASSANQVDGQNGIDNSFGKTVSPMLSTFTSTNFSGHLKVTNGTGIMQVTFSNTTLRIQMTSVKLERNGTVGTLSAILPTEPLVQEIAKAAGAISKTFCSGSTIDSIKTQIRQASDILAGGAQDPTVGCDHISYGAAVTGIRNETMPVVEPGPDPCANP